MTKMMLNHLIDSYSSADTQSTRDHRQALVAKQVDRLLQMGVQVEDLPAIAIACFNAHKAHPTLLIC